MSRSAGVLALALAVGLAGACGSDAPGARPTGSPTASPDGGPGGPTAEPGTYDLRLGRIRARLRVQGAAAELTVSNRTGTEVGAPSIEWIDSASGASRRATVAGTAPIPAGEDATFAVELGEGFGRDRAGLVILHLGSITWGALSPPVA